MSKTLETILARAKARLKAGDIEDGQVRLTEGEDITPNDAHESIRACREELASMEQQLRSLFTDTRFAYSSYIFPKLVEDLHQGLSHAAANDRYINPMMFAVGLRQIVGAAAQMDALWFVLRGVEPPADAEIFKD